MKKLLNFIRQRWFISLLGIIALALLIWFVGPLFAFADYSPLEAEENRWFLIIGLFLFWLIVQLWFYYKNKKKNNQVMSAMMGTAEPGLSPDQQASMDELQTLKKRMQEALDILKQTKLGGGFDRQFLYQLPWYIIIGPPGSGKTTLLKNSDLKFPLSDRYGKDAIRGVGGTRNCDWWFADDAVLLDTAGRYTTQDSHETVDQAAWLGFLDLLKKNRSRRPINGVIIAVSVADLLQQNSEQQLQQATAIRKRIQELYDRFNIRFPVYLLFTKCDLLAGFMEFFDDLDHEQRSQVWGMTFPLDEQEQHNALEQFNSEFPLLQQNLQRQLLYKLEQERSGERRNLIYTFPQQFSSLQSVIKPFLEEVFQTSRYAHPAMFRGIYFTSATQEGSPIDRIMGSLANNFGLDNQLQTAASGQGKSFFINRLLRSVIFAESGLAGTNLKLEKKRFWMQRGAFVGLGAVAVLMAVVWVTSYMRNQAYIEDVAAKTSNLQKDIETIDPEQPDPLVVLPLLNRARDLPGGFADQQHGAPWSLRFGLYQGDKLGEAEVSLYHKLLKNVFLPRLLSRLENQLQTNTNNSEYLYEALKAYLMIASAEHYDAAAIANWFKLDWKYNLPLEVTTQQRNDLDQHLQALLAVRPAPMPRPLNAALIQQTRDLLMDTPVAQRVYSRLKLELSNNDIADFRVSEKAGRDAPLILISKSGKPLSSGVPGLFTCAGYKEVFLPNKERLIDRQASDNWVFGIKDEKTLSKEELKVLQEDVLKLYLQDYIKHWDELLQDIQLKPFTSQVQMVEMLNIISGEHSPIKLFLQSVDQETSMACLAKKEDSLLAKASEKFDSARSSLDRIMSTTPEARGTAGTEVTINMVTDYFKGLHEIVLSKDGVPPPLDRTLSVLNELYVYLNSLLHASGDELVMEQRKQIVQVIEKVKLEGKRTPFPVSSMMDSIAEGSGNLVSGGIRKHLNAMWRSTVLPFCQKAIQGLYPIAKNSREITYEDFTYFFGPGGLMDEFFNKYLAASVEKGGKNWRWNSRGEGGGGISYGALKQFQRADNIKNIFFRMGKQAPTVSFKLKPISMSPSIVQFVMDVDGQVLTYAHGPLRPVAMKWPGPNNSGQVRVQLLPPLQGYSGLSKDGPWALFRVFDEAHIARTSNPAIFIMTFNIQGREVKLELQANSAVNPFQLNDLQSFQCLSNL
ncbi:type VI secretion system membrane subunit TssM [Methylomarinum vadi]|uniref:type VI secretion system membrane subunit TssM n=1 Tax=Methylomarinum vadi TaxID=438855 RepID=UPI000A016BF5|nr:type VI secretion system membrane subunit TssM [Methylomarinum vadi]